MKGERKRYMMNGGWLQGVKQRKGNGEWCFDHVMHGRGKWGGGDCSEWCELVSKNYNPSTGFSPSNSGVNMEYS